MAAVWAQEGSVLSLTPSLKGCDHSPHTGMQVAGALQVSSPHGYPSALDHRSSPT